MELHAYFQSYENYFWQWESDEDVPDARGNSDNNLLSIPGSGVIAYRPLIEEILKVLQPGGLPGFGSLLLILIGTQRSTFDIDECFKIIKQLPGETLTHAAAHIPAAMAFVSKLHSLPTQVKQGQNRLVLLQTILKNVYLKHSSGSSQILIRKLEKRPYKLAECAQKKILGPAVVLSDIRFLALLDQQFPTVASILKAMQGLIPEAELEEEVVEEAVGVDEDKDFIQQLIDEPKTFQVGSLIKRIWSGLKIPMRHLSPGEQPIGGISDMTNKGDLHRMLLSEFANEDEVFLNRVANNEALYIQREIPPEENIFERVLLIDASLKNWGTPKILAFAVALAIVKHPKANTTCKVFILGKTFLEVTVDTVQQVIDSLNEVSPVLDVASAIDAFFETYGDQKMEAFLLTHESTMELSAMLRAVHEHREQLKYLVTTSLEGDLNIFKYHNGTKKHIQKIILPLEELWANPSTGKNRENAKPKTIKTVLPKNYPLLFPPPNGRLGYFIYENEHYLLSTKKQLLKTYVAKRSTSAHRYDLYRTHRGFSVLFDEISIKPKGHFGLARNAQQELVLCQFQPDKKIVSSLNLVTKDYTEHNVSAILLHDEFKLIGIKQAFYLYHEADNKVYEIPTEKDYPVEETVFDKTFKEAIEHNRAAMRNLPDYGPKILKQVYAVGINAKQMLVVSNLEFCVSDNDSLKLGRNSSPINISAIQYRNQFTFHEGSRITSDARGVLIFNSSNKNLPEFYISCSEHGYLAIASHKDFGGSEYYIHEYATETLKTLAEMNETYLEPFIRHIVAHETEH